MVPWCFLLAYGGLPTPIQKFILCSLDLSSLLALESLQRAIWTSEELADLFLRPNLFLLDTLNAVCKTELLARSAPQPSLFHAADVCVGNRKTDGVAAWGHARKSIIYMCQNHTIAWRRRLNSEFSAGRHQKTPTSPY